MANTTNFGWETPDDTDLVKDGAAAIRTLGSAIDASLADLEGGTTGQVLKKNSNTDMDFIWSADSAGMTNPMTTTGDTIYSSSGSTPARLGIGSTGNVLTVAGGVPTWAAPASGGGMTLLQSLSLSGASTTSSTFTPGDYVNYFIVLSGVYVSAFFSSLELRLNGDTGSNYNRNTLSLNDTTVSCGVSTNATNIFLANIGQLTGVNEKANGTILISRINDTNQVYVQSSILTTLDIPSQRLSNTYASYDNSAAISTITFLAPAYNFSGGTAYIYGVK